MNSFLFLIFFMSAVCLSPILTWARFTPTESLSSVAEFDRREFTVRSSGKYIMKRELQIRVITEDARNSASIQRVNYNGRAQKLRIVEAYTISAEGKKLIVPEANIEDKEVSEPSQFFDSIRMVSIAFPQVAVGAKVYIRYELEEFEVPVPDFFDMVVSISDEPVDELSIKLKSELPLFLSVNDPEKYLQYESKPVGEWQATIKNLRPIRLAVDQERDPFFRTKRGTFILASTKSLWPQFATSVIGEYETLLKVNPPEALGKAVVAAKKLKNPEQQFEAVLAFVADEFRYFGDWRRRRGGHIPRGLTEIVSSKYGDCKDLSLLVTAILRQLGFKAHLAWIFRSELPIDDSLYALPSETTFNHAIVRVETGDKVFWLDPTNPIAYIGATLSDISDRFAFVVDPKDPRLEKTPSLTAQSAINEYDVRYRLVNKDQVNVSGNWKVVGRPGLWLAMRSLSMPAQDFKYEMVRTMAGSLPILDWKVGELPKGRIFRDATLPIEYTTQNIWGRTSAGQSFSLSRSEVIDKLLFHDPGRVADVYLGTPTLQKSRSKIENSEMIGRESLDCDIDSEWLRMNRRVKPAGKNIEITEDIEVKKSIVPIEAINSQKFVALQDRIRKCYRPSAVIFRWR